MSDRQVFDYQIREYELYYDRHSYVTVIDFYSYEYLWGLILRLLYDSWGMSVQSIFSCIAFTFVLVSSLILLKRHNLASLAFLVNPLVVDVAFSQLRVALAASLLGAAYLLSKKLAPFRVSLVLIAVFVHSATPLFLLAYFVASIVSRWKGVTYRAEVIVLIAAGVLIGLLIGPLRYDILSSFGDRRAEYTDISSSFVFLLPWVILLIAAVAIWRNLDRSLEARIALIVLALVATNLITGGYSTRFIAVFFSFLVSFVILTGRRLHGFPVLGLSCYAIYQWILWFQL